MPRLIEPYHVDEGTTTRTLYDENRSKDPARQHRKSASITVD